MSEPLEIHSLPMTMKAGGLVIWREYHMKADVDAALAAVKQQLPAEMQDCTILFKECKLGHGRLTATNWIEHGCATCAMAQRDAEIGRLTGALTWLLNLHCGVSKHAGDGFHHSVTQAEWREAIAAAKQALAATPTVQP